MEFERFLRYSLRHNRPVRVLVQEESLRYLNLTVIDLQEDGFAYRKAGRRTPGILLRPGRRRGHAQERPPGSGRNSSAE